MSEIDTSQPPMTPDEQKAFQARQKQRAVILAGLLLFLCVLFYLITIVKIGVAS